MIFLQTNWILAFVCAVTYFNMGVFEQRHRGGKNPGMFWALLSIATSALVIQVFNAGWVLVLLAQAGLFIGITVFRMMRER